MSLAAHVRTLGRGPGRSRSLTRGEAREAMALMLSGAAEPQAIGALLMLMRYHGETAAEVAGFVEAMRDGCAVWPACGAALDWPTYAAGRSRGLPWFLLSARLVARAGAPVLLHGWNAPRRDGADVRALLSAAGVGVAGTPAEAGALLARERIVYAPLEAVSPAALGLLRLRDTLGLRSAVNTALRALNPGRAGVSVQGVFHPPYRALQQDAALLLGQSALSVIKGGGGEFERHPAKAIVVYGLRGGAPFEETAPALLTGARRLAEGAPDPAFFGALWRGETSDPFAEAVVTGTAALALHAAGLADDPDGAQDLAAALWRDRLSSRVS